MESILVIFLLIMFFLMISIKNSISNKFNVLQDKIDALSAELRKRQHSVSPSEPLKRSVLEDEELKASFKRPEVKQEIKSPQPADDIKPKSKEETVVIPPASHDQSRPPVARPPKVKKPGFFERNPDLEKFIGENLANKIGIGILVLGIGFFVKYAIDQDWINEIGRVFIGILCGGILLGIAHRLRKTFMAFSSVLVGGGIAVLYLTIAIAFHEYHIFGQTPAFVMMVGITAFAVVLSLGYDRVELAVLAILGGFASPFMVSTGEGNFVVLFTYILILDIGMLVLAYYKKWNLVNIVAYAFTIILFGAWLGKGFDDQNVSKITGGLVFATLYYVVFFAMNIIHNVKRKTAFQNLEITLLLSNTFFYYAAGMTLLANEYGELYKGLFTAALGVFNFIFAYTLHRSGRVDRNLVFLLIGLVLTFISLAAPIQLEGNYITLFWSAEAVLLLWLSQKSGIRLMKLASVAITGLMVISLLMDWQQLYVDGSETLLAIILNKAYITSVVALASLGGTLYLLKFEHMETLDTVRIYKTALTTAVVILLYTANFLELQYQLFAYGFRYATQNVIIGSYNMGYLAGLLWFSKRFLLPADVKNAFAFLGVIAMLCYMFFYQGQVITVRNDYVDGVESFTGFIFHYVLVVALLLVVALSLKGIQQMKSFNRKTHNVYSWFYVFFFVFMASAELDHIVVMAAYSPGDSISHILSQNHKIGYPILWGVTSFVLIALGLKKKIRHLRIISLSLFLITLLKLFLIDIKGISEGGKIAAFISLGLLLLVVSFMYQRLKKLLLADAPVNDSSENQVSL